MTNTLSGTAVRVGCKDKTTGMSLTCPASPPEAEGDVCCSGGMKVSQVLGHAAMGRGNVQFNGVSAPADGTYDVVWYYYCGNSDTNGDTACPWAGQGKGNPPGCRPAQFVINGMQLPTTYQFPCFAGAWNIAHLHTVSLPLKAGSSNTIKIFSTGPDVVDLDRIVVGGISGPSDAGGD
jgi:hypothetical protein